MEIAINKNTGTRHIADGECGNAICGELPHSVQWENDPMLDDFPEDFGRLPRDCGRCSSQL